MNIRRFQNEDANELADIRFYHINHSISVKNDSMNSLNRMKYNIYHKSQNHLP